MAASVWYEGYDRLREEVQNLKERYEKRCVELGAEPGHIQEEIRRERSLQEWFTKATGKRIYTLIPCGPENSLMLFLKPTSGSKDRT